MIQSNNNNSPPLLSLCIITHERPLLFARAYRSALKAIEKVPATVELTVYNSSQESMADLLGPNGHEMHVPELGAAVAKRRLAIEACKTRWIVFLDDDCEMTPGALLHVHHLIRNSDQSDIGAYFPVTRFVGPKGFWFRILEGTGYLTDFQESRYDKDLSWGTTSFAVFEVNALRSSGGFDASIDVPAGGEDVDVCLKLRRNGFKLAAIPEELAIATTETWNSFRSNFARSVNYGRAEFELQRCWPDYRATDLASPAVISFVWILIWLLLLVQGANLWLVLVFPAALPVALFMGEWGCQFWEFKKPLVATFGLGVLQLGYRFGYVKQALQRQSFLGLCRRFDWVWAISFECSMQPLFSPILWIRWGACAAVMALLIGPMA